MSQSQLVNLVTGERFKLWLSAFLATQLATWLGYLAAWGNIPFLSNDQVSSGIATLIASIFASAGVSIAIIVLTRVDRVLNLLAETAEADKNSDIKAIVMKTDAAAESKPSPLVVGPSDI